MLQIMWLGTIVFLISQTTVKCCFHVTTQMAIGTTIFLIFLKATVNCCFHVITQMKRNDNFLDIP